MPVRDFHGDAAPVLRRNKLMSLAIQQAINQYLDHIQTQGETKRADRIRGLLKNGMYPIKYVYLLILEKQL